MKFFIVWDVKGYLESLQWEKDHCVKVDLSLSRAKLKDNSHIHKEMHYNPQDDLRSNILGLNLEGWYAVTYYYILKLMILRFYLSKILLVLVHTFGINLMLGSTKVCSWRSVQSPPFERLYCNDGNGWARVLGPELLVPNINVEKG